MGICTLPQYGNSKKYKNMWAYVKIIRKLCYNLQKKKILLTSRIQRWNTISQKIQNRYFLSHKYICYFRIFLIQNNHAANSLWYLIRVFTVWKDLSNRKLLSPLSTETEILLFLPIFKQLFGHFPIFSYLYIDLLLILFQFVSLVLQFLNDNTIMDKVCSANIWHFNP